MNIEETLIEMRRNYNDFLNFEIECSSLFCAQVKMKRYNWLKALVQSFVFQILVLLLVFFRLSKPPKYIFQGLRHIHLIKVLPPSDVMVIGGRNEFIYCRKMGYRFHWAGYLGKCFELFYFANKTGAISDIVSFFQKFFTSSVDAQRYLFLWESTQPIGLTLSLALRNITGINVVCIAHGYHCAFAEKRPVLDGAICNFNFVYDAAQAKFFNKSTTFILGLPYEVKPANTLKPKVVLVEHTGVAAGAEYIISVFNFIKIYRILKAAGFDVTYRIRPGSDERYARSMFSSVCGGDKFDLFAEGRMIFIGFNSTLLYEAKVLGNIVVGLDTSELFDQRNFDVDATVSADEYNELPSLLSTLMSKQLAHPVCHIDDLYSRFIRCIESIENYNKNHG